MKVSWKIHLCDEIQGFYSFILALGRKAQAYLSRGGLTSKAPLLMLGNALRVSLQSPGGSEATLGA